MKILVPVKRVVDANVKVWPKPDGTGMELTNAKMSVNPFCEIAVEEALRIKEAGLADEVVAVSVGTRKCQEQLRVCFALGADRGILVEAEDDAEPLFVAKLLKVVYEKERPELVVFGKQSIDGDNGQTGQMFAALTGLPQATFASEISISDGRAEVVREVDGGLQKISVSIPAVITTDLRLNEPRFATLMNIMKAKNKRIDVMNPDELGVLGTRKTWVSQVVAPPSRPEGVRVGSVQELVSKLRTEAKVIP